MKKLILMLVMISFMSVIASVVIATNPTQGVSVGVISDMNLAVLPLTFTFGDNVLPGTFSGVTPITLTPGMSNLVVGVSISSVNNNLFKDNTQFDINDDGTFALAGLETISLTANTPLTFNSKLFVPIGFKQGTYSETITYTVNSAE